MCTFPPEVKQGNALPSCSSSHTIKKCLFHSVFNNIFWAFFLVTSLLLFFFNNVINEGTALKKFFLL